MSGGAVSHGGGTRGGPQAPDAWARAAAALRGAEAFVFAAGAGMGVDSGLPDFRGDKGFWKAYPPYERLGLSFVQMANPAVFARDAELAWGFYGHRLRLYRDTVPHEGFAILRRWAARAPRGAFVFTSNVDGQFQRAGFAEEAVVECHGSLHHLQCTRPCSDDLWAAPADLRVQVDTASMRARPPLPRCPRCGALARPNVLMFGDGRWVPDRTARQEDRLRDWLAGLQAGPGPAARLVILECGAGTAVPTVRHTSEALAGLPGAALIRVNPREPQLPAP